MGYQVMPDGTLVEIDDAASPETVAKIKAQFPATRQSKLAAGQTRTGAPLSGTQKEANARADAIEKMNGTSTAGDFQTGANKGLSFGFIDRLGAAGSALTKGAYNAITKGDIGEIGNEYNTALETQRELQRRAEARSPVASFAGELSGGAAAPIGLVGRGAKAAIEAASPLGRTGLAKAAEFLANKPIASAAVTGAGQGALNAIGNSADLGDAVPNAIDGAVMGGVAGGAAGALMHGGQRLVQAFVDRGAANAERTAAMRYADRVGKTLTPEAADAELAAARAAGNDMRPMDLNRGLQADAAYMSRLPSNPESERLAAIGADRVASRNNRFTQAVEDTADAKLGTNSDDLIDTIKTDRKNQGAADYVQGGIMDRQLAWTPELEKFFKDSPDADELIRNAYKGAQRRGEDIGVINPGPDGTMQAIPSMRVFDRLKRAYDDKIGAALSSGRRTTAGDLSANLSRLKELLGEANPDYAPILARQRDLFQRQEAVSVGEKLLTQEPRQALRNLGQYTEKAADEARTGMLSYLVSLDAKANPVGLVNSMLRNEKKRKLLEFAFGSKDKLAEFEKWLGREARSQRADQLVSGNQSITSDMRMIGEDNMGPVKAALSGLSFGSGPGALLSAGVRAFDKASSGMSPAAQGAYSRLLTSEGDIAPQVAAGRAFGERRAANNMRRARGAAKAAATVMTDYTNNGSY